MQLDCRKGTTEMKRHQYVFLLVIGVILAATGCVSTQVVSRSAHVGTWEGIDDGDRGIITLNRNKTAVMQLGGKTYGGEDARLDGQPYVLRYRIDYSKKPMWIDFIMVGKDGTEMNRIKGIFTYLSRNQIMLCLSFRAAERPLVFEETSHIDTIIMSRL